MGFIRKTIWIGGQSGRLIRSAAMPWLLLAIRIWLGQQLLVHQIVMMVISHMAPAMQSEALRDVLGGAGLSSAAATLLGIASLFLFAGLLTRPIAFILLARLMWSFSGATAAAQLGPHAALLAWLVVAGAGTLSFDALFGRGLASSAFRTGRIVRQFYASVSHATTPILQLALRFAIAASAIVPLSAMVFYTQHSGAFVQAMDAALPGLALPGFAIALILGVATRPVALFLAIMIPLSHITMSMDGRLTILLLFLTLLVTGAGPVSIDNLIVSWAGAARNKGDALAADLPQVVVVGGGFGGIAAVQGLRAARCRVMLIDKRNHHLFQPLLYQVATAALSPAEIATPIRSLFRNQQNVSVSLAEVTGIDTAANEVELGQGRLKFDYLIVATGARHGYFGKDEWARYAPGLKSIEDATAIRGRLLLAFEAAENATNETERTAWLTFVIVGGGPTGVELAGAIVELAKHGLDKEYRAFDPAAARVVLVQSAPRVLPNFTPASSAAAARSLQAMGVEIWLGIKVKRVDGDGVIVGDQHLAARTVLWAAGVTASPAAHWLNQPGDASGRLAVSPDLSVPDHPDIYGIGDTVSCRGWHGDPVPGLAPAAKQAGQYAARAIIAKLEKRPPPPPFRYRHLGSLATIGRQAAVADLGILRMWGAPAWWFWGAAHVAFLVGGRNRMTVILDWFWAYVTYRRSTRLITAEASGATSAEPAVPSSGRPSL